MIEQLQNIKIMIYEAYPNLSGLTIAYLEGLEKMLTLFTNAVEEIIQRQCAKVYLHLEPEPDNKQQELVKQKILDISQGRKPREALEIIVNFEEETFHKLEKCEKITLDDYINFARKYGYSIGKVLIASTLFDEYLSHKAIKARNTDFEDVKLA